MRNFPVSYVMQEPGCLLGRQLFTTLAAARPTRPALSLSPGSWDSGKYRRSYAILCICLCSRIWRHLLPVSVVFAPSVRLVSFYASKSVRYWSCTAPLVLFYPNPHIDPKNSQRKFQFPLREIAKFFASCAIELELELQKLEGHEGEVSALAFSHDAQLLPSASSIKRSACGMRRLAKRCRRWKGAIIGSLLWPSLPTDW